MLILVDHERRAFATRHLDWRDFRGKIPRCHGGARALLRSERKGILVHARDLVIFGDVLGNQAQTGGAIAIDQGTVTSSTNDSIIQNNTATSDGGGVFVSGGLLNLSAGDQVINNTSVHGDGGGIAITGGTGHALDGTGGTILVNGNGEPRL